eukprot:scaffold17218_cov99-Phaeocystis_antarctica.AAC.1
MPHMRRGPDTWHVSQTRRCVESSLLSPFKPREPAERRVDRYGGGWGGGGERSAEPPWAGDLLPRLSGGRTRGGGGGA